jgi:hypothetical protein
VDRHNGAVADDTPTVYDPAALEPAADLVSRRRARKWVWGLIAVVAISILGAMYIGGKSERSAPDAPKAFCKAAADWEDEVARTERRYQRDIDRQLPIVENLAATAPRKVRADAQLFLSQMQAIKDAPNKKARDALRDDPDVIVAVANVNRYASQGCGFFKRQGGI